MNANLEYLISDLERIFTLLHPVNPNIQTDASDFLSALRLGSLPSMNVRDTADMTGPLKLIISTAPIHSEPRRPSSTERRLPIGTAEICFLTVGSCQIRGIYAYIWGLKLAQHLPISYLA
jgi:hypothetical protein